MKSKILLAAMLALSACNTPKLPDPAISYPKPPDALMQPPQNMQEIPTVVSH